ncbi:unnamed protein product [Ixodes pacificus]
MQGQSAVVYADDHRRSQKMFAVLGVLVLFGSGACQIDPSDGCSDTAAVACVEHLVPFVGEPRVPETPEELEAHCELETVDLTCGNKYVERCLQGFFRGVSYAALNALRRESAGKCNASHPDHKRYLAGARCLNRAGDRIHECYQTFKEELYRIIVGAAPERRLEHGCCETSRLFQCKQRSVEKACGDSDTDQPVPGSFERSLGELVTLYCQPYEHGSSDCAALDELPKLAPNETVPQSLVLLMKSYVATFG